MESKADLQLFTRREREILNLIAEGYENKEIADNLHITLKTVEKYLDNLKRKSNLHNLFSVMDYAFKKGWINIYEILESYFQKRKVMLINNSEAPRPQGGASG